jgi:hypothetical protein
LPWSNDIFLITCYFNGLMNLSLRDFHFFTSNNVPCKKRVSLPPNAIIFFKS